MPSLSRQILPRDLCTPAAVLANARRVAQFRRMMFPATEKPVRAVKLIPVPEPPKTEIILPWSFSGLFYTHAESLYGWGGLTVSFFTVVPSIGDIMALVCEQEGITIEDMLSPERVARLVRPRHIAMYLSIKITGKSLKQIATKFDRDHTTLISARRRVELKRLTDQELDKKLMVYGSMVCSARAR